jgi:endonuclease/exonuclease/phosphatase family metal-dependent hydrolase
MCREARDHGIHDKHAQVGSDLESGKLKRLKLLSFNIQVGLSTSRYRHYVTRSWRHVLPSTEQLDNLERIAELAADYDLVGLQETDAGSLRSANLNQVRYLAERAGFPHWHVQVNRDLGQLGQHSLGLLSRLPPVRISEHRLPGLIPGRGAMVARFGSGVSSWLLVVTHLSLSKRARALQLRRINELVQQEPYVVVMGDTNCEPEALMDDDALGGGRLRLISETYDTYPSWRPRRNIDHVLVSEPIPVHSVQVIDKPISDHLPLAVELDLPAG